ncbi:MAG: haloacid dehalogenase type II [Pseudomonadota bacterium]
MRSGGDHAPRALLLDVFGTLVDWRTSVAGALKPYTDRPEAFADAWRSRYQPSMDAVRTGRRPFVPLDTLHRESLDQTLEAFAIAADEPARAGLNLIWHHLDAWSDVGEGLSRLGQSFILAPHSNGNVRLLVDLARHNGWRWDAILGAEVTGHYKPEPESYRRAAALLMLDPGECAFVAAHNDDLVAARACGFSTIFLRRPTEHGPNQATDLAPSAQWDLVADSLPEVAERIGH